MLESILHLAFTIFVSAVLLIAFILAILGVIYFFAGRETTKNFKEWRGKK